MRMGFRTKLMIVIALLIGAIATFFAIYVPHQQEQQADRSLEKRAVSLSTLLANLAAASVVAEDMGGAKMLKADLARSGTVDSDIAYIVVTKPDGKVFARYRSKDANESIENRASRACRTYAWPSGSTSS